MATESVRCTKCKLEFLRISAKQMSVKVPLKINVVDRASDKGSLTCPECGTETPIALSLFNGF